MATERIYALFQDVADAERAIGALQDHGIGRDHIGVVARRPAEQDEASRVRTDYARVSDDQVVRQGEPQVTYEARPGTLPPAALAPTVTPTSTVDTPDNVETVGKEGITLSTPQDAAAGAAVGSGIGLVAGLLAAAAALTIPGVGIVLGGGILASALGATAAATAAGAVAGGVAGYLRDMGMPQQAAQSYADRIHEGDYLVTVDADTARYDELKQLLLKYNAAGVDINVASAGEDVPPAAVAVPPEALTDVTPQFVDQGLVYAEDAAPIGDVPEPSPQTVAAVAPTSGLYELREPQIVEPVLTEPAGGASPDRFPSNPALAQETEPMAGTATPVDSQHLLASSQNAEQEIARLEAAHIPEGQERDEGEVFLDRRAGSAL